MKGFQTKCLKKLNKQKIVIIVNIQILIGNVKFISDTNFLDFSRQKNYNTWEEKHNNTKCVKYRVHYIQNEYLTWFH